jgi:hypothetical protein
MNASGVRLRELETACWGIKIKEGSVYNPDLPALKREICRATTRKSLDNKCS